MIYFIAVKRFLPIWVHGKLGKIHWNIIIKEIKCLGSPKNGRYAVSDNAQAKREYKEKK